ncbi:BTAD domain-containing putative transcriptional regulator [Nonomuraea rubra]|uniref:BTAD domain-containing putative transcriptional regulator n=1 Tax=Nonomuraea rubra TaxID=46180 RepID=UPI003617BD2B
MRPEPYELGPADLRRLAAASEPAGTVVIQRPCADAAGLGGPSPSLAASEVVLSPCAGDRGLGVGAETAAAAAGHLDCPLDGDVIERLVAVTGGRPGVIDSVLRAACLRGGGGLGECVMRASGLAELVASVTVSLLRDADPSRLQALALAARLGYAHEDLSALRPALREPDKEPWWEPLTGGWYRMLPFWSTALCALRPARSPGFRRRLALLAGELVGAHAVREAVELSRRADDPGLLAELLAETDVEDEPAVTTDGDATGRDAAGGDAAVGGAAGGDAAGGGARRGEWEAWGRARAALVMGRLGEALQHGRRARDLASGREPAARGRNALRLIRRTMRARSARKRMVLLLQAVEATTWPHPATAPPQAANASSAISGPAGKPPGHAIPGRAAAPEPGGPRAASRPVAGQQGGRAEVEAWLLGTFRVRVGGRAVVEWSGKLGRSVLMYLLLSHPKPIRRDVVLDAIWPGVPENAARNRLNATVHALRADLRKVCPGRQVVVYERETYALAPDLSIWLDIEEFTEGCATAARLRPEDGDGHEAAIARHEAARALYSGDLLEDAPYLDWVVPERERLSAAHVDLLNGLAALYLEAGAHAKCVDTCRQVLARDSCREQTHRLLMRCHARQNQPHKALAQYETCRRELDAVLGMTPSPETHALYESVRRHLTV